MNEEWLAIPGYEGLYEASSFGRIRSSERLVKFGKSRQRIIIEKILKPHDHYRGYDRVDLCKNGLCIHRFIHRLVAMAFLKNPKNLEVVNHKDRNKKNNAALNLEWVSYAENTHHWQEDDIKKKAKITGVLSPEIEVADILSKW